MAPSVRLEVSTAVRWSLAACLLLASQGAFADDVNLRVPSRDAVGEETLPGLPRQDPTADRTFLSVNAGVGETDNVLRSPKDGKSQSLALVGADFDMRRASRTLDAEMTGDFSYVDYLQGAFKSTLFGRLDGTAGWQLVPEVLRWSVEDSFGQSQLDPLTAITPGNIENVNVVATGPDLVLRPFQSWFVKLAARYAYATYETNPYDNRRILGDAAIGRDLSVASKVSLKIDYQRIEFQNTTVNTDYDRRNFYAEYDLRGARTELTADLGASQAQRAEAPAAIPGGRPRIIRSSSSTSWDTTPFARLRVIRALSAASTLQLTVGRQYTDVGDSFQGLQNGASGRILVAPAAGTTSNYLDQYVNALWTTQFSRTSLDVSGTYGRNTYLAAHIFDVDRASFQVRLVRRLTSVLTGEVSASAYREHYFEQGVADNSYQESLALSYRPARRLEVKLRYDHESRIATGGAFGFAENRALLTVGYKIFPPR